MNTEIMKKMGFTSEVEKVEKGICPFCNKEVDVDIMSPEDFREYKISGLCKSCQDGFFG
jgi:hypothetical protein